MRWFFKVGVVVFEFWKSVLFGVIIKFSIFGNFKVIVCIYFIFLLFNSNKKD